MIVNGENMELGNKKFIVDLIRELDLNSDRVVVEIDKEIVPKEDFENRELNESNIIEVISFVGGG